MMDADDLEDFIEEAISDSLDVDWHSRMGARAVLGALSHAGLVIVPRTKDDLTEQGEK